MAGELGVCLEAVDWADLAEQLRGAQGAAAGQCEQGRSCLVDLRLEFAVEGEDGAGEAAAAADELAADPHLHRLFLPCEPTAAAVEPDRPVERARRHRQRRLEVVEMPAQPLLDARALLNEILAVVDEEADLPLAAVQARGRQRGLTQCCPRDREGVDRIRLAVRTSAPSCARHQLGRHAHDPLARREQQALE